MASVVSGVSVEPIVMDIDYAPSGDHLLDDANCSMWPYSLELEIRPRMERISGVQVASNISA